MAEKVNQNKKENKHYINNNKLVYLLLEHQANYDKNYQMSDELGECFDLLCKNIIKKHNFCMYPYKDDMLANAIENCISAANNFDCVSSLNAYGFFSMIIQRAFIRVIKKEKDKLKGKLRYTHNILNKRDTEYPHMDFRNNIKYIENLMDKYEV